MLGFLLCRTKNYCLFCTSYTQPIQSSEFSQTDMKMLQTQWGPKVMMWPKLWLRL